MSKITKTKALLAEHVIPLYGSIMVSPLGFSVGRVAESRVIFIRLVLFLVHIYLGTN